jgi:hypothetical protein
MARLELGGKCPGRALARALKNQPGSVRKNPCARGCTPWWRLRGSRRNANRKQVAPVGLFVFELSAAEHGRDVTWRADRRHESVFGKDRIKRAWWMNHLQVGLGRQHQNL